MRKYNIAIIGVGLIGGSLGMALKKLKVKTTCSADTSKLKVIGIGRHKHKLQLAKRIGAVDEYTTNFADGVKNADIVVIATPVDTIVPMVKKILPFLKPGCIITDVGSVKKPIVVGVERLLSRPTTQTSFGCHGLVSTNSQLSTYFVGAHPLAGSEKTGVKFATADMFKDATVVITPTGNKTGRYAKALKTISDMWRSVGGKVIYISPEDHDQLVSITSHLPHVLSAALVEIVNRRNKVDNRTKRFLAGSFRDITRISDSDASGWAAICQQNKEELTKTISSYIQILNHFKSLLNNRLIKNLPRTYPAALTRMNGMRTQERTLYRFFLNAKNNRYKLLQSD
ncbi:MAG: prephenate dehydrogenase [Elusimicrobiota bacterium]|nr:prephenate dehydrogenase [Elusimicrobiota bacterium]